MSRAINKQIQQNRNRLKRQINANKLEIDRSCFAKTEAEKVQLKKAKKAEKEHE